MFGGGNGERQRGRAGGERARGETDRRGLNLPQVVPLSPAKGESDYELKRSFVLIAFSTASLVGELRLSWIYIHANAFLHRGGRRGEEKPLYGRVSVERRTIVAPCCQHAAHCCISVYRGLVCINNHDPVLLFS